MMPWLVLFACSGSDNNSYTLPPPTPSEVASKVENTGTVGSEGLGTSRGFTRYWLKSYIRGSSGIL